jgi:8-oxo-dGTP diphosphatase
MLKKIIIASGPVIVENNKVLLNNHGDTNFWKFCGGKIEKDDEGLAEAAQREVKEEMGIGIEILKTEPFITYTTKKTDQGLRDVILVHWLAKRRGEIKKGEEIREWQWFDIDNLPDNLAPNILPTLKHFGFIK